MARPKKQINYTDELMRIDAQITRHTNTIKELQDERKALLDQQEQEEARRLLEFFKSSGLSMNELTEIVKERMTDSSVKESA